MTGHTHAVVWMDSREAHIFFLDAKTNEEEVIESHPRFQKVHHKAGEVGPGHAHPSHAFFDRIVADLRGTRAWLLCGPAQAKDEMAHYIRIKLPALAATLRGIESMAHPSDGVLLDRARRFFRASDRMQP